MPITINAKQAWRDFNTKYQSPAGRYDEKRERHLHQVDAATKETISLKKADYQEAAERVQCWWKRVRSSKGLYPVSVKTGNHTDEFYNLVACVKETDSLKKLLNKEVLEQLLAAIEKGDWNAYIFKDKLLPYAALSLFASGKITRQQMSTLLEMEQLKTLFHQNIVAPLLDENGNFTENADKFLLPKIFMPFSLKTLSPKEKEDFRLLLLELPKSEHFYWYSDQPTDLHKSKSWFNLDELGSRYGTEEALLHIGAGARDALGIARLGMEQYVPEIHRLGTQTIDHIEHGMSRKEGRVRHGTVTFPGVSVNHVIHEKASVSSYDTTAHDYYHSQVCSLLSPTLHRAKNR